jgi:hypothetical protein
MSRKLPLAGIIFCFLVLGIPGAGTTVETERLIIRDITGKMPPERFEKLTSKADSTLTEILRFWSAEPRVNELGKIIVEFDHPLPKASTSIFFWGKEKGQRVRVVRVFGGDDHPHLLAHKLTSAVFPNPDKLIRNMMGEASEKRFGNPLAFPMCGFDKDEWIMALLQVGSYIPFPKIGPDHSDWGMEIKNNVPEVKDRAKQHASYLEAGSFGEFLITTYDTEKMKQFNRLSRNQSRPWKEVFGLTLEQLEAKWLEAIKLGSRDKEGKISTLVKLVRNDPNSACFSAQNLAEGK